MTARRATDALTRALITIAAKDERTHCSDPATHHLWQSDRDAERAEAVKLCRGCPVILECRQAADARDERWHVWGGLDPVRTTGWQAA
jgi:hypothetical protein